MGQDFLDCICQKRLELQLEPLMAYFVVEYQIEEVVVLALLYIYLHSTIALPNPELQETFTVTWKMTILILQTRSESNAVICSIQITHLGGYFLPGDLWKSSIAISSLPSKIKPPISWQLHSNILHCGSGDVLHLLKFHQFCAQSGATKHKIFKKKERNRSCLW